MTNSKWRIGDFLFPTDEEPERFDFKSTTAGSLIEEKYPKTPYPITIESGKGPSNLTIQGKLTEYGEGTMPAGPFGLSTLQGQCSFDGVERVLVIQAHDGTLRRAYGIPKSFNSDIINTSKNLYGYVASFRCLNPYLFDNELSNTSATTVSNTDTTIDLGSNTRGSLDSYPIFIIQNDTGSTLTDYTMTIGDGSSSDGGNSIVIPAGGVNVYDGQQIVAFPYVWNDAEWRSELFSVHHWGGTTSATDDVYENTAISDYANNVGSTVSTWPRINTDSKDLYAKGSAAGAKLIVQWRKAYG